MERREKEDFHTNGVLDTTFRTANCFPKDSPIQQSMLRQIHAKAKKRGPRRASPLLPGHQSS